MKAKGGPGFDQKRAGLEGGGGGRGGGKGGQFVHESYKPFRGDKSDGFIYIFEQSEFLIPTCGPPVIALYSKKKVRVFVRFNFNLG